MNMLHHISFSVTDLERSAKFYDAVTAALGYGRVCSSEKFIGYGIKENEDLFAIVSQGEKVRPPSSGFHLAFSAKSREVLL